MSEAQVFDARLPVRVLLARFPEARPVLASHGLDACCGGEHPLVEACAAKGVVLAKVLSDLETVRVGPPAASRTERPTDLVPPTMSIRELRRRFPSTAPVLERYGLADCGGEDGPDEPLAWFATVHRLPLDDFLRDVREAARRDTAQAPATHMSAPAAAGPAFSPHFLIGSLFLTLTLGATTGMINLLRIAAGADVPISHRQIHGHTQILGFAALFVMGISYHALPRILGIGAIRSRSARPAFWMMFAGVLLRNAGQPLGFYPVGRALSLASAALEAASGLLFAGFVFHLLGRVREGKYGKSDPILRYLRMGTIFLLAAMACLAVQGIWLAGNPETAVPVALTEPFYFAALYGFLLAWIYGFGNRVVVLFLGVSAPVRWTAEIALVLQTASVPLFCVSYLPFLSMPAALLLRDAGMGAAALAALVYLGGHGIVWRRPTLPMMRTPGTPTFAIRAAFACLGLWALLELAGIVLVRTTRLPAQNLWWADAARHTFTIGFLTLLIIGMSLRILPVFSGKRLWSPKLAYATYALLLAATGLRLLQYPAAFRPVFYVIGSYMGILVVTALVLFTFNLVRTMRGEAKPEPPRLGTLPVRA